MKRIAICVGMILLTTLPALAATQAEAEGSLKAAQAEQTKALAAQAAWTSTDALLADAKKAEAAKDWAAVKTAADEALAQAKRSLAQSDEQKTLWHDAVLR